MLRSNDLLRPCLLALKRLTGAGAVSLYFPAAASDAAREVLIHEGGAAVDELADRQTARELVRRIEAKLPSGSDQPLACQLESPSGSGRIVRISNPSALLSLLDAASLEAATEPSQARRRTDTPSAGDAPEAAIWIGLRLTGSASLDWPARLDQPGDRTDPEAWRIWALGLSAALSWHAREVGAVLHDPVTSLPGRNQFQAGLRQAMESARERHRPFALVLINPVDFVVVNENFGREAGDSVICEIAHRLRASMRSSDLVGRYGGAVFSLCLLDTDLEIGQLVAEKLRRKLTEEAYLQGAVRLDFGCGMTACEPGSEGTGDLLGEPHFPLELIRRADRALNLAKQSREGRVVVWNAEAETAQVGTLDRLSGIFTANLAKDYRNMLFLWDTVNIVSRTSDFESLAIRVVERMRATFRTERVALFSWSEEEGFCLVEDQTRQSSTPGHAAPDRMQLESAEWELLAEARRRGDVVEGSAPAGGGNGTQFCCAVPLVARQRCLGCLYVEGGESSRSFDRSDLIFLKALAGQLAVTLDRSLLAAQERRRQERERQLLRSELNELRRALQEARLVYRSAEMESVVRLLRRLAPTDATLLITGESGTGKELLARTAHELSPRSKKPFVVVDCGAIAAPLIERELFGHERGAYTGAEKGRGGRLAEANGGSIILDEIGELPLEVQTRFLRFAQEKQLTPVGGTRSREVDVRLIAVTNRDLEQEVAAGRFRADLFYRLNVAPIVIPPLRERPDDIVFLARHFLKRFSVQYQKGVRRFSPEAEERLISYLWPGNVRELQNRILRAVILCDGEEIGEAEIEIDSMTRDSETPQPAPPAVPSLSASQVAAPPAEVPPPISAQQAWSALESALAQQVDSALARETPLPLGRWLAEDLVLEADARSGGVRKRGAALLGIPETTYRRRLRKARTETGAGLSPRAGSWDPLRPLLADLLSATSSANAGARPASDLLKRARDLLLRLVLEARPGDAATGARLMGITDPTFRRWTTDLAGDQVTE